MAIHRSARPRAEPSATQRSAGATTLSRRLVPGPGRWRGRSAAQLLALFPHASLPAAPEIRFLLLQERHCLREEASVFEGFRVGRGWALDRCGRVEECGSYDTDEMPTCLVPCGVGGGGRAGFQLPRTIKCKRLSRRVARAALPHYPRRPHPLGALVQGRLPRCLFAVAHARHENGVLAQLACRAALLLANRALELAALGALPA